MPSKLNIGYIYRTTRALGPGKRYVVWLRGCQRRCPGCASPELRDASPENWVPVREIVKSISLTKGIDGVTVSGGEPLLQSESLGELLRDVRARRPELSVILFTGYKIEELPQASREEVIPYVDLLVDGEYVASLNDGFGLRGSSNQRFLFLTDKLLPYKEELEKGERKREMHLLSDYELLTIGIPPVVTKQNNG